MIPFFLRFHRINVLVHKRVILEEAMAWLSTLGGGFSSLGDHYSDAVSSTFHYLLTFLSLRFSLCRNSSSGPMWPAFPFTSQAEIAGSISVRQMTVAMEMGDPVIQAKCRLWFAQSRMQIGDFKTAAQVIRWHRCVCWMMIIFMVICIINDWLHS